MAEDQVVHEHAEVAARTWRVDVIAKPVQMVRVKVEETQARQEEHARPSPAMLQVAHELEEIAEAEKHEQHRQHESARAKAIEQEVGHVRPGTADEIMRGLVGRKLVGAHVATIKRDLRHHQEQRCRDEHDANDVAETALLHGVC